MRGRSVDKCFDDQDELGSHVTATAAQKLVTMASKLHEADDIIGYEIPVEFSDSFERPQENHEPPTFNLDALDVGVNAVGEARFELMEIHITLYTLSGILYHVKKPSDIPRRRLNRPGTWRKNRNFGSKRTGGGSVISDTFTSTGTSTQGGLTLSTISESCPLPSLKGFEMNPLLAPTTAVVSSTRNDPMSERPMETFMPSLPLHRLSRNDSQTLRYSARWKSDMGGQSMDSEEYSSPSFKILRLMNQQQFIPSSKIGDLSTYEHEQVDLCVFVGRGKELIPIGVVSFVVTGDEEMETILNLPVKKPAVGSLMYERHFKHSKRKKGPPESFDNDPSHTFSVGGNSVLRIGVRAFPQRSFLEADERSAAAKEKEEKVFESVLQKILDTELLVDLNDESSLFQRIVDTQIQKIQEEDQQKRQEILQQDAAVAKQEEQNQMQNIEPATPCAMIQPNVFCNYFSMFDKYYACPGQTTEVPAVPQQVITVNRKKPSSDDFDENATVPLTLVSSVSESVTTVGGHSNTRFHDDRPMM